LHGYAGPGTQENLRGGLFTEPFIRTAIGLGLPITPFQ
jgi:hypothetical protein